MIGLRDVLLCVLFCYVSLLCIVCACFVCFACVFYVLCVCFRDCFAMCLCVQCLLIDLGLFASRLLPLCFVMCLLCDVVVVVVVCCLGCG